MNGFLLLHQVTGMAATGNTSKPVWVSIRHIASIDQAGEGARLYTRIGIIRVVESVSDVLDAIRDAERSI